MTEFELAFIKNDKFLKIEYFFDAKESPLTETLKNSMKLQGKLFAFNTTPCSKGHTLKTRKGHCIVCHPATISFTLREYDEGYVYIAGSLSKKRIKIGSTNNIEKREKYLNENKGYANINDWKILYYVKTSHMGKYEHLIQCILSKYNEPPIHYLKGKEDMFAIEVFRCSYKKAYDCFIEHFNETTQYSKQIEPNFDKYKFPNLSK